MTLSVSRTVSEIVYFHCNNNGDLYAPPSLLNSVISNDIEWLSKIFNDTKRRAASLRKLSYLFVTAFHVTVPVSQLYCVCVRVCVWKRTGLAVTVHCRQNANATRGILIQPCPHPPSTPVSRALTSLVRSLLYDIALTNSEAQSILRSMVCTTCYNVH